MKKKKNMKFDIPANELNFFVKQKNDHTNTSMVYLKKINDPLFIDMFLTTLIHACRFVVICVTQLV